ncbi:hypothetical protein HPB50_002320 [Hyalomma asiaticum]|uniref:Uncharacterized protein n=1 Tax=Hyalomma asiaticum TaxID=266040 RepID=A0ACB7RZX1_HYAAI|nr:hypothetical protein HPB50_002320 [Hyalomma asiaticum]
MAESTPDACVVRSRACSGLALPFLCMRHRCCRRHYPHHQCLPPRPFRWQHHPKVQGSPMQTDQVAVPKEDAVVAAAPDANGSSGSPKRVRIFEGGFKSNEAYTYVRGRGRGKYVCEECGIRCKKPSMLKKHIRTHTDLRPFSCHHCCFAFKTKGNLTKHMKSKAHHKKCTELGILPVPTTVDDSTQVDADTLARQANFQCPPRALT